MGRAYQGVLQDGQVVLRDNAPLPDGTAVIVVPEGEWEDEWLSVPLAADLFGAPEEQVHKWAESGKVRRHPHDPSLVSAGDVEDAIEQHELLSLTLDAAARDEDR